MTFIRTMNFCNSPQINRLILYFSLVDPQVTDYCLVVSSKMYYDNLCFAQADKYGISSPFEKYKPISASQTVIMSEDIQRIQGTSKHLLKLVLLLWLFNLDVSDPIINCVGSKTHNTLTNLKQGQEYYFNLFAIDRQTNFTYPHGRTVDIFDYNIKPISLKDGKSTYINLKKFDGKAILRFKVRKHETNLYPNFCHFFY